jgi:nicotinamide mononucleotide (NMN) deamidase PncC
VLDEHGTIARETTQALAEAARLRAGADIAVATTGVAGPDPSENKPVGVLHIVVDVNGRQVCQETRYSTTRAEYKRRGALEALGLLWRELR